MKKQIVYTRSDSDQAGREINDPAAVGSAFSLVFPFGQITNRGVHHRFSKSGDRGPPAMRA
jgi:hypothetical protein